METTTYYQNPDLTIAFVTTDEIEVDGESTTVTILSGGVIDEDAVELADEAALEAARAAIVASQEAQRAVEEAAVAAAREARIAEAIALTGWTRDQVIQILGI
jgi:hypothetical protein